MKTTTKIKKPTDTQKNEMRLMSSYMFRAIFAISNQTLTNWERRGKLEIKRKQIHHVKLKHIVLNSIKDIPKKYEARIKTLHNGGLIIKDDYQLILKSFK